MKFKVTPISEPLTVDRQWEDRKYTVTEFLADINGIHVGVGISDCKTDIKKGVPVEIKLKNYKAIGELMGQARASVV